MIALGAPPTAAEAPCTTVPAVLDRCPAWTADLDDGGQDAPAAAEMSPSGDTLFVTGFSADATTGEAGTVTAALDPSNGQRRWTARENGPGPTDPTYYGLAVAPDGDRVYVFGMLEFDTGQCAPNPCGDAFVAAYDATTGEQAWKRTVDGPVGGWDYLSGIAVSPDGTRVFAAGASQGVRNDPDFAGSYDRATLDVLTMALDSSDGSPVWSARYDRVPGEYDAASSIAVSPGGERVFVGGNTAGALANDGDTDYLTLAYDSGLGSGGEGGRLLWAERLDSDVPKDLVLPWDVATDLELAPDGSTIYVTGQLGANRASSGTELFYNPPTDFGTAAYDAEDGARLWLARYPGVAGGYNIAQDLALSPSGHRVYVTGISSGRGWEDTNDRDAAVIAYDASDGDEEWSTAYVPGYAYGWQVATRGDLVYLAASSTEYSATLALSAAEGTTEWTSTSLPVSDNTVDHLEARGLLLGPERLFTFGVAYPFVSFGESVSRIQAFDP